MITFIYGLDKVAVLRFEMHVFEDMEAVVARKEGATVRLGIERQTDSTCRGASLKVQQSSYDSSSIVDTELAEIAICC